MKGRLISIAVTGTLATALGLAPVAMAGTTYYAAPNGSGSICSSSSRCRPEKAAEIAQNGDVVLLAPGTYELTGQVDVSHAVEFGGESTAAATVLDVKNGATLISDDAGDLVHDLSVVGTSSFLVNTGSAERIYASVSGSAPSACSLTANAGSVTVLRDSVCWIHDSSVAAASGIHVGDFSGAATARLFNDDGISATSSGNGLRLEPTSTSELTVEATNSILRGLSEDILVTASGGSAAVLANSNFRTAVAQLGNSVTAPGTGSNQTAEPLLAKVSAGNFRELAGSPTIGAGALSSEIGSLDLDRNARSQGGSSCSGAPDIGAYEWPETTPACQEAVKAAPSGHIVIPSPEKLKISKPKLNKLKGTATVRVKLPSAGRIALSGKHVKEVVRTRKGPGRVVLLVQPAGKAAKKLGSKGKLAVEVLINFKCTNGVRIVTTLKLTLRKTIAKASH